MNLILLFPDDFVTRNRVRLTGRRRDHVAGVHRAAAGRALVVGAVNGLIGTGTVVKLGPEAVEMDVVVDTPPPAESDVTLILALPRPKVLNRAIAAAASMGVKRIHLINAWRVEKSYWKSPRLAPENLLEQSIAGLEQARDTVLPQIRLHRLFREFVEGELPSIASGTLALTAHPHASETCPRDVAGAVTLAVGPEGGFIDAEIVSLERAGLRAVTIGPRALRVETALAALMGRLKG